MRNRDILFAAALVATFLPAPVAAAQAVDPDPAAYRPRAAVSGLARCAGGDTMHALASVWAARFHAKQTQAEIVIDREQSLSADGVRVLIEGRADCVLMVREPFPAEIGAYCKAFGSAPLVVKVAGGSYATRGSTHAIAVYVNAANPLSRATLAELDGIFSATRRRGGDELTNWGQLGLTGEWADRPIHAYGMLTRRETGNPPGIVNFLELRMLDGGRFRDDLREQRDRPGETALQGIVHRVREDVGGIGFSGFGYAEPGVKSLALAETSAGPFYRGTIDEVARREYPLGRDIYLLLRQTAREPASPLLLEFLRLILSAEGQRAVAEDGMHFLPLSAAQATAALMAGDGKSPASLARFFACP